LEREAGYEHKHLDMWQLHVLDSAFWRALGEHWVASRSQMGKKFDHKRINDILYMRICFGAYCFDLVGTGSLHYILS
jgi:hypothetical protein